MKNHISLNYTLFIRSIIHKNGINPADLQNILKQKKIKELGLHKED